MKTVNKHRNYFWFPTLIIVWNLIDIAVHVATNLVEPLRIAGNLVGIAAPQSPEVRAALADWLQHETDPSVIQVLGRYLSVGEARVALAQAAR